MSKKSESCENCRFFVSICAEGLENLDLGECVRYPPVPMHTIPGKVNSAYPQVETIEWCGEWEAGKNPIDVGIDIDQPVEVLALSVRTLNCFASDNIITLRDLLSRTERDLMVLRSFGKTSLNLTKEALKARGLWLGMLPPKEKP